MPTDVPNKFEAWWRHFRQTGDICPLRLGMSRDEMREILGEPNDTGGTTSKHKRPLIWRYADVEFHFGHALEDGLHLIYCESEDGAVRVCISQARDAGGE